MIRPILGKEKVVGIPDNNSRDALSVYPNPSNNGLIILRLPEAAENSGFNTMVFASTGKLLINKPFSREENFSHLSSGVYFIQVSRPDGSLVGRSKLVINQ